MSAADQAKGPSAKAVEWASFVLRQAPFDDMSPKVPKEWLAETIDEAAQPLAAALREATKWNWIDGDVPGHVQRKVRDALRGWEARHE